MEIKDIVLKVSFLLLMGMSQPSQAQSVIHGDIAPVKFPLHAETKKRIAILKSWQESFDGRSRFKFEFFSYFSDPEIARLQAQDVPVFDGEKPVEIYDWDTADCSYQKMALLESGNSKLFLITAVRLPSASREIQPQYLPALQRINVFELIDNKESIPGLPRRYFKKTMSAEGGRAVCERDDVYKLIEQFVRKNFNSGE